jgi:glycosyltransferase involved in cell wall biosynthesis
VTAPDARRAAVDRPVVHVVAAGEVGGAERMLVRLAAPGGTGGGRPHVVALWTDDPALAALFAGTGFEVLTPPARPGPRVSARLRATGGPDVGWLAGMLSARRAVAVHLHTFASHVLGTRAGLRARVPIVRTEHSTRVYDDWRCRPFSGWSLRHTTRIVAVSAALRRTVEGRHPELRDRLSVIRNGVPLGAPGEGPPPRGPLRLVMVARLEPRKGIDVALRALAQSAGTVLDVVGDGPLRAELEGMAATLGLGARVRFWGYRSDPEAFVARADAALCSSRTEGLPVGLLEAMALGRPVVAVPVGGVPEIVVDGDTGWLAAAPTPGALVAALRAAAAAGRDELRRRGARARELVARGLTDGHMRAAYEDLYEALAVTGASVRARPGGRDAPARSLA